MACLNVLVSDLMFENKNLNDYRFNKAFFIVNKNGYILHNDSDRFYDTPQWGFGVYPLIHQREHTAYRKAKQVGGIVVHMKRGESLNMALKRNAIKDAIKNAKNSKVCVYFPFDIDSYYAKLFQK